MKKKFWLQLMVFFLFVFLAACLSQMQKSSAMIPADFFGAMSADPTVYYPSSYGLLGLTTYSSGNLPDLQSDNSAYMIFSSYQSQTSNQTLYAHQDTTTIGGTTYYLSKLNSSDSTGTSLSKSVSSTGRKLFGQFAYSLFGVSSIPASTWTVYYRTWVSGSGSTCHDDVDIIVRQSNGTIRTTIATNVATSASLTTTQQTLLGTYSFSAYTVMNQTDYLEIDYYVHVTTSASRTAYLRIDDNTLGTAQQTRAANIYLPSEYTSDVEFLGSSDANAWTQLVWAVDSSWTRANVSVTIQLYNYTLGGYPASGNGYLTYTSSSTANTDETKNQTISTNPLQFRNGSGNWRIRIKGVASTTIQFAFKVDLINLAFLDTAPPLWSNGDTNNNVAGQHALFYAKWNDNVGLSGQIFGSNNTGVWANDTWVQMGGLTNWSNVTKTLNSTSSLLQWRVWANDTSNNWNDTGILSFKVLRPPISSFTFSPSTLNTGDTVTFNASSSYDPDGTIVSYYWTFGDGTNATGTVTTYAYANNGVYTATLKVTDNDTLTNTTTQEATVLDRAPVASFTNSLSSAPTGTAISFNASDSYDPDGTIVGYYWTFGDGTNNTGVTASHSYSDNGTYTVTLTVTDDDGSLGTAIAVETILNRPPVASFTASADNVQTNVIIYLNASASNDPDGTITSFYWSFGDGTNATGMNVQHAYSENGTYLATLTVTDNDLSTASANTTRTILNRPPVAIFTDSGGTVYTGQTITLNASASYDPDGFIASYFWSFGDGTNSTGVTTSHAYAENGTYTMSLTLTDNDGAQASHTSNKTILDRPPVASFTTSATTLHKGEILHLNASVSYDPDGSIVSYFWTFGDGTNGTGITVDHSYANAGNYTVNLNVIDNDGSVASTSTVIAVLNQPPIADFTASPATVNTGDFVSFSASGSYDPDGVIVGYLWAFGDGTNASGVTPAHSYADNGTFVVTLRVTDNDGATATTTATVTVLNRPPVALFTQSPATVFTGDVTTFNASASYDPDGAIVSYFWAFGDGSNATGLSVGYVYVENGVYNVILTLKDNDGSAASSVSTRTVLNRPPVAIFTKSATSVNTGQPITFNASASYDPDGSITGYFWSFGDGVNATGVTASYVYADNGTYTVTLAVTDNDGSQANSTSAVTILNRSPVSSFLASATNVHKNDIVHFNASASYDPDGTIASYFWTFGNGANATGITVDHSYPNAGTYTVSLTVTDNDGSVASTCTSINIENQPPIANFTASPTTVNTGVVVNFDGSTSYDPDGVIVGYLWTFGDGFNASGVTPAHSYVDNGTFVVTLKVIDNDGATASITTIIAVLNRPPVASFTGTADTVLTGDIIYFNASASNDPDGSIASYFWSFGDGANATGVTISHAYADNGTYTVTLTVTDNDGASSSSHATKTVLNRPPVASFTKSATPVFTGVVVSFNASGSYDPDGSIINYLWAFGDGNNATGVTTAHSYADNGTFVVTLRVTDNDGATATSTAAVTVLNRPPIASFTQSSSTVSTGDTVNFNASGSYDLDGSVVSYFWSFGDGANATGMTANHSYNENGSCTVILTVTDNDGSTGTANATETVLNRPPVASFTQSANPVYTYTYVYFEASGSYDPDGTIISYFWTFGDGSNATGTAVSHAYLENANYTVVLNVTDNDGSKASSNFVETVLNRPPIASFTVTPNSPIAGFAATFDSSNSHDQDGTIVSYIWNFGDGNITTTASQVIAHTYQTFGICNVTLTVTDNDAAISSTSNMITVRAYPLADFTLTPTTQYKNQAIAFNASTSDPRGGVITSYFWTFGDGSQLNTTNPAVTHTYGAAGNYSATLTVTDSENLNNTLSKGVSVLEGYPVAFFTYTPAFPATNQTVIFDASSSFDPNGYVVSYIWNFGDGNVTSIADLNITHKYATIGNYTARLTVTDSDGLINATFKVVTVGNSPTADFTYVPTTPYVGDTVTFNASASMPGNRTIINYVWDFGDGSPLNNETIQTTVHSYRRAGNFTATMTITWNDGLTSTTSKPITIMKAPIAIFTISPTSPQAYDPITFNASGSYDPNGYVVGYIWDFGDGNVTTTTTPITTHYYAIIGNYSIVLVVSDNSGYTDSATRILTVTPHPPHADFSYSPDFPKIGENVSFNASQSYDIDGSIISYNWNFGDGNLTIATNPTITHAYASYGNYTAILTVIDQDGLSDSKAITVRIRGYPTASFTITPSILVVNDTATFDASSSLPNGGTIMWYFWVLGDGSHMNVTSPAVTHAYAASGNFTVTLMVSDSEGLSNTTSRIVHVSMRPEANFTYVPLSPHTGDTVTFNASASKPNSGVLTGYTWIFGDGNTTSTTNPIITHVYSTGGNYTVMLTVQNSEGLSASTTKNVTVQSIPPYAVFDVYPATQATNRPVTFNASGSYDPDGSIANYTWTFGDGNITVTSVATITHVYSTPGNYTVTLQVKDNQELSNSTSRIAQICLPPLASFTYSPVGPYDHQLVTFNASGSYDPDGSITSYNWDFGDGITGNATNSTISHSYLFGGDYQVRLVVVDNKGLDGANSTIVHVKGSPVARFTWSPSYPIAGDTVIFNASSSSPNGGTIGTYAWDFGDGVQLNTSNPIASHVYSAFGNFTVTLTVIDSDQLSNSVSNVTRIRDYPTASFVYSPSPVGRGSPAVFDASASDPRGGIVANYTWNFGDGNVIVARDPVVQHVFNNAGMFQVKLTVYDDEGLSALMNKTVEVVKVYPIAIFTHFPDKPLVVQQTTFDGIDSYDPDGYIVSYVWNFGDGVVVSGVNLIVYHNFNVTGTYNVTLTVQDNDGYSSSAFEAVDVIAYPCTNFSWSPYPYPVVFAPTVFNASSSSAGSGNITTYVWNFGDGNISTTTSPVTSHMFNASGLYNVALTVTNSHNLSSSNAKTVSLCGTPIADFTWTPVLPQANSPIAFDASASKPNGVVITGYAWSFGDGTPTVQTMSPTVSHTYTSQQAFNVTSSVKNIAGLIGTTSKQLIVVSLPQVDFTWTPASPFAYDVITFNASASSSNGAITSYTWSFDDGNTTTALVPAITHFYSTANVYVVTLNVTDNYGLSNATSKTLNIVPSQSPLVDFTFSPLLPGVYEQVVFDASGTIAEGGLITGYSWNFGNGTIITVADPVVRQTYQTAGNFMVTLNATNTVGYWSILSKLVQIMPTGGPKANFTISPAAPSYNQTLTFDASNSVLGWNGTIHPPIVLYTWSFGDSNTTSTTTPLIHHAYSQKGDYTVTLAVIDASGKTDSLTRTIAISSLIGDINGDGKVDMRDIAIVAKAFSTVPEDQNWNPIADLNGDGRVDMRDIAIVAKAFNPT
jgi:PKD repeat protein